MITLGIDLASQPETTAACSIEWRDGRARVVDVACDQDDEALLRHIGVADKVGIDVPFGWPETFVGAVAGFHAGGVWPEATVAMLRYRETDRRVRAVTGRWPLSVSTDRLGVPAFRAARLLAGATATREPVDRSGTGLFVEVYPAAALRCWGFTATGYKGREGAATLAVLWDEVQKRIGAWFDAGTAPGLCRTSADAFDALVAALVARAAALGWCERPPAPHAKLAAQEGWIALPAASALDRLASATPAGG